MVFTRLSWEPARVRKMHEHKKIPAPEETRQHLRHLHRGLLHLHKALLNTEREVYERLNGTVTNSELLRLALNDEHFTWLRAISQLIIGIDEMLDNEEPASSADAQGLFKYAKTLLKPAENGDEFERRYFAALQRDPTAVLAHHEVAKIIAAPPEGANGTAAS
jgi:hypothetical protein